MTQTLVAIGAGLLVTAAMFAPAAILVYFLFFRKK